MWQRKEGSSRDLVLQVAQRHRAQHPLVLLADPLPGRVERAGVVRVAAAEAPNKE